MWHRWIVPSFMHNNIVECINFNFYQPNMTCPVNILELYFHSSYHCSKTEAVYEDPHLQDNPAYGTTSTPQMGGKGEENYETCFQ